MSNAEIAPASNYAAVTKSDSTDLGSVRSLYVGGAGDVAVSSNLTGAGVTFTGVTAGSLLPIACRRVMSTNTTATAIVALY
ncbi:MAG: hypothetical protein RLZZ373_3368 [Pseudomonadota bacterium]|jgi:hypothetical protein